MSIPNSHPAIITQEQFDTIAAMINKYRNANISKNSLRPLNKKVWCGNCNHLMRYKSDRSFPVYQCPTVEYSDKYGCAHDKIREKELHETILNTFLMQINLFINNDKLLRMNKMAIDKPNISTENFISQLDDEIKNLQLSKRKLYEQYANKKINKTLYLNERESLENELKDKTKEHEELILNNQNHKAVLEKTQQTSKIFLKYQSTTDLTKEIVDKFIESVKVYDTKRIIIKFKFQDGQRQQHIL